jgi:mono/diheme cytochrome c family protein
MTMKRTLPTLLMVGALALAVNTVHAVDVGAAYAKHCASCHGKDGKGETKAGKKAKAVDLTDAAYQQKFTDEQAFNDIKNGRKDGDREQMKPFADKLSDEEIKALVAYTRKFAK